MNSSSFTLVLAFVLMVQPLRSQPAYKNKHEPIDKRIADLVGRMTLEEKILQLNQYWYGENLNPNNHQEKEGVIPPEIGSIIFLSEAPELREMRNEIQRRAMEKSRLGIPILFGFDVIHGMRTVYPIPLAQACSWNPALVFQAADMAARETKPTGINWIFSPMIDIARDPRWGRVAEGFGEDPYAASVFCVATVKGYQGTDLSNPYSIAACLKHFAGYGMSEGGRDYHASDISAQSLWETYLPPYEAGVKAGAATLMSAFNDISGVPATANHYLLTEVLKRRWGYDGFVVSDWNAIIQLIAQGVAKDRKQAGLKSFLAGVDMDMVDRTYSDYLKELVGEGKVSIDLINASVARVLRVKFRLGLFDRPYTTDVAESEQQIQPADKALAAKLAEESMVLLKNEKKVLPLSAKVKTLAVIGPLAKDKANLLGCWSGNGKAQDVESIYEGLTSEFGSRPDYSGIEPLTSGYIQVQSEGAEVFYRDIAIQGITEFPAELKQITTKPAVSPVKYAPIATAINPQTTVGIVSDDFYINGKLTYEGRTWNGHRIEGLLMNSRMVQGLLRSGGAVWRWQ